MTVTVDIAATDPMFGNGVTTTFPFTLDVGGPEEVAVYVNDVLQTTGFTVTVNTGGDGGNVTFASPPINGSTILIETDPTFLQETSFANAGQFLATSHDAAYDRAARRDIWMRDRLTRAILVPRGETPPSYAELLAIIGSGGGGGGGAANYPTRTALAAAGVAAIDGDGAYLTENGRKGSFRFYSAISFIATFGVSLPAAVAADPQQGVYVAPTGTPDGSGGAWVRESNILNPYMFGATNNYVTGDRTDFVPPFGESQTPGAIDGVLADSRVACQAMIDLIRFHENRHFIGDFSGGIWGISKRNDGGAFSEDGLYIDQPISLPRIFIGGAFRAIGSGRNLIYVRHSSYSHFIGDWHVYGGADFGSGYGYTNRTWENGLWVRDSGQAQWGAVRAASFKRWGIEFDPEYNLADYNNNIGLRFRNLYATACGSKDQDGYRFTIDWTASNRTGVSGGVNQRTNLTLAAGHEILRVGDMVKSPAGTYHLIAEKVGNVVSLYPWMVSQAAAGTLTSLHGGGVKVEGKDVAGAGADNLTAITCGVALDVTNVLHGPTFGQTILEGSTIGLLIGTVNGIAGMGITIDHIHCEGTTKDIIAIGASNVGLNILSCSAFADQDYADAFKKCLTFYPNDGTAMSDNVGLPWVSIFIEGATITSGSTFSLDSVTTKSRAFTPAITNNPNHRLLRKVITADTNISLKYYESVDRCIRNGFVAEVELVGAAGAAPANAITITIDATDFGNGIEFANGTTTQTYVIAAGAATGPVKLGFWLDTNGATKRWIVIPLKGVRDAILDVATEYRVNGQKVVGARGAALPADAADLATAITLVNAIKARMKVTGGHGLVAD